MATDFPRGLVTLVFTDLESSSQMSERHGAAFEAVRDQHFILLREAMHGCNGCEVETAGDALFAVFSRAADAVQFAVDAQCALLQYSWPPEIGAVRVRIGMHSGEPYIGDDHGRPTYRGPVTNRAARVQGAGHGAQILLSHATYEAARGDVGAEIGFLDCGMHALKGVGEERLWQVLHPQLPGEFPPLNTLSAQRHNLPSPTGPLLGRESEVAQWYQLLQAPDARLLSLVGMGGMGKTRAALELANRCVGDFTGGVWWMELDEACNAADMYVRIASALRFMLRPDAAIAEQVHDYLRERQLLLVLDNTEQIPDAPKVVAQLLHESPGIKCLVTSRRRLALHLEQCREIEPLPDAVAAQLFVERARGRGTDFDLTPDNTADVHELCRRLEGVPLALELAASRIESASPREILRHLDQRFRVLQTRAPDLPPRQRALRGAIDWSYHLLSEEDKELFARLAVFARGFTGDDAVEVCDSFDALDSVAELRAQSLLRAETEVSTQRTRFQMLESVRAYAQEKLDAMPSVRDEARKRHARHFRKVATHCGESLRARRDETQTLHRFESDIDNIRLAFDWMREKDEHIACAELALALGLFLQLRGFSPEAIERVECGIEAARRLPAAQNRVLADLLRERSSLHLDLLETEAARRCVTESYQLFEEMELVSGQGEALNMLGLIAGEEKDVPEARACLSRALELFEAAGDSVGVAKVRNNLGFIEVNQLVMHHPDSDQAAASEHLQTALALHRANGDRRGMAETLTNLGVLAQESGEPGTAWQHYQDALLAERELKHTFGMARALFNLGEVAEMKGDIEQAQRLAAASAHLFHRVGSPLHRYADDFSQRLAPGHEAPFLLQGKAPEEIVDWAQHGSNGGEPVAD